MSQLDPRKRRFNSSERAVLYLAADGICQNCGDSLPDGWHGDHVTPYSAGGPTDVLNGQALCPTCNLKKGTSHPMQLRQWQQRAVNAFYAANTPNFLVSATPGAGKTMFSLHLAKELLRQGKVERVNVVAPSDSLRVQWAKEADDVGLNLFPVLPGDTDGYDKQGYDGCVVTYQQLLGTGGALMRRALRRPAFVILDEVHHAGDNKSWGESLRAAVEPAVHRLCLTGTPWRRDSTSPIPFVRYDENGTVIVDYAYEYGAAVADGVCRRIEFHAYDGEARWTDPSRGRRTLPEENGKDEGNIEFTAKLGANMAEEDVSAALDTVYEPKYAWMPSILRQADEMLTELRETVPDAAGLVIAERQWLAKGYADLLEQITGTRPPVVVSDPKGDPRSEIAKAQIESFRKGTGRWIVAVKMISEGVDIPRLAVGVYASKTQTPLFYRQVVGRFVRTRPNEEINARLLIPAVPELMQHAREIEEELRHQLEIAAREDEQAQQEGSSTGQGMLDFRTPLSASEPTFDRAILSGDEVSAEELAAAQAKAQELGIPRTYAANLVPLLRAQAAQAQAATAPEQPTAAQQVTVPQHRREKLLRQEVENLARKISYRRGCPPKDINADLLRAGHPKRSKATVEELEKIRQTLLGWLG
ncbi:DEAD/DEAH box helicase family protein [Streptomyces uncialis]|uniref:DEAD/DEAH box helicase family protein n=1 Tax=Streptomyces uncialis TaxID=1048205 RepID=UPI0034076C91